jgi:signal transduction histidine kinase
MIDAGTFVTILLTALIAAAVVGMLALIVLRIVRRARILVRLLVVATASTLSIIVATIAIAREMYISEHDLVVLCWVIGVSAALSALVTTLIGAGFTRSSARLQATARAIGEGRVVSEDDHDAREFGNLARELAETSRKLADAREEVARMDESRRRLFAWISHDLRTPLAAMRAMAESLDDGVATDPRRYHRQILGQVETLSALVDDLFELSKIQSGILALRMEHLSLFDLVSDAVADLYPLAAARSVTIQESRAGDLTVWGDARELSRVISNLLINAIQHSPPGSEILLSARETRDHSITFSVADAGGGIPDADLERVFEAGWRGTSARTPHAEAARSAGAGLGLAIVRGIVQAHSGDVSVRNVPGGCRFDVILPSTDRPASQAAGVPRGDGIVAA